ncbi:ASCH domain-containing protein [Achromobacter sp. PAB15]|uniref:ASCH domain-containing protein n=1 Tax=Achromobacter sp. PAB15 TaxID=3233048 RepID=UPI003F90716A
MSDPYLPMKDEYFDAMKAGTKTEEYRMACPYWTKRIKDKDLTRIVLTRGYPKQTDEKRRLVLPWKGFALKRISHPALWQ